MPSTLKGWIWLTALLACMVFPYTAKADDIMDCIYRGQLAGKMAETVIEGYDLDKINVNFQRPAQNAMEQAELDAYVESVRNEVRGLTGLEPSKVAARVAETCAFEYGKKHGYMKDVNFRTGSTPPMTEQQASDLMMGTASSQGMAEANARYKECEELLTDQIFIAQQLSRGQSADALRHLAKNSAEALTPERLEKVLRLIDEAEDAVSKKDLRGWFDSYWHACYDGK